MKTKNNTEITPGDSSRRRLADRTTVPTHCSISESKPVNKSWLTMLISGGSSSRRVPVHAWAQLEFDPKQQMTKANQKEQHI